MKNPEKPLSAGLACFLLLGCGGADAPTEQTLDVVASPASPRRPVSASEGFSWIVPGELAAMPLPGRDRPLDEDAAFLEQEGIAVLVSLTEDPPDGDVLAARGIDQENLPIRDFTPPTLEQMIEFADLVGASTAAGKPVGVHCTAGLGRSGTMAAAYLVSTGIPPDEAIASVRDLRPGSVETPEQEEAVRLFAEYLRSNP